MISVFYFATIQESTNIPSEQFQTPMTLQHLQDIIVQKYAIDKEFVFAVNLEYVSDLSLLLKDGDEVALIPPVSGG
jgi:molybdopterin converting factor subunit 1